jgi:Ca2+-binding RTX toxin-like protein
MRRIAEAWDRGWKMAEIDVGGIRIFDAASSSLQGSSSVPVATDTLQLVRLGEFTGSGAIAAARAEVADFDAATDRLFVTNAAEGQHKIDVAQLDANGHATKIGEIPLSGLTGYGGVNSVAVKNGVLAVVYGNATPGQPGFVAIYDAANLAAAPKIIQVGVLPDMVTFTPDGKQLLIANEAETVSPANNAPGSVTIIDVSGGVQAATVTNTIGFGDLNGSEAALKGQGLALFDGQAAANDIEPEYIAVSADGTRAYVTLQEVNGVAVIDLTNPDAVEPLAILPLGGVDRNLAGNQFDPNDQNGISLGNWDVISLLQPDAIASFTVGGSTYFITANEGDARVGGLADEYRISSGTYNVDTGEYAAAIEGNGQLGRLNAVTTLGNTDADAQFEQIHAFGGRGVTIFKQNADGTITKVRETGGEFERIIAEHYPALHNTENGESLDTRSDNKGPEPEGVAVGVVNGRTYAFVTLERVGGVMIYDVTDPANASFVGYKPATAEDYAPETVKFISAADSPTGKALVISANEVSGTTTIYEVASASSGADSLRGGEEGDLLKGLAGNDTLAGNGGNDTLDGGAGDDLMRGGGGNDTLIVDSLSDKVERNDPGVDTIRTALDNYTLDDAEKLVLTGSANLKATGGSADDDISGNTGANLINGGSGRDTLAGADGNDTLQGGSGDDLLQGGVGDDALEGGSGVDSLSGAAGADTLAGASGDDTIAGGADGDKLTGGSGADRFVFAAGGGADTITDYNVNGDILDFGGQTVTYGSVGADALNTFADGGSIRLAGVKLADYLDV